MKSKAKLNYYLCSLKHKNYEAKLQHFFRLSHLQPQVFAKLPDQSFFIEWFPELCYPPECMPMVGMFATYTGFFPF